MRVLICLSFVVLLLCIATQEVEGRHRKNRGRKFPIENNALKTWHWCGTYRYRQKMNETFIPMSAINRNVTRRGRYGWNLRPARTGNYTRNN